LEPLLEGCRAVLDLLESRVDVPQPRKPKLARSRAMNSALISAKNVGSFASFKAA
jgi:hypothetical protein